MSRDELKFRAALSRFAVALVAFALLPTFYPRTRAYIWLWGAYVAVAAVEQVLIRKRIGGKVRPVVSGLVDLAMLTFWVHTLGSTVSPMVSLYLFAGVANALVANPGVAWTLAVAGPLAYDVLLVAEHQGWLAYAPGAPGIAALGPPPVQDLFVAATFVTIFVPACTAIVTALVRALERREAALVLANERLEQLSQLDPLTNLYNRRHLFARIEAELARVRRGRPMAVVMIDLDRFKAVNDTLGHLRGDVLLKEIAGELAATTRATDVAGRYGGDEFVLVLPDTVPEQARSVAERVAQSVRDAARRFDATRPVTASVGIAVASPGDTVAALLRRADENAYKAKQDGGDRVVA